MMYGITVRDGDKSPLVEALEQNGVETRDLLPLIDQPVYDGMFASSDYPVSQRALTGAFYIGCHQGLDDEDVEHVGTIVDYFYGG
jgi:dTDP-4-amino-4,6-dideoxygalactose transaminase